MQKSPEKCSHSFQLTPSRKATRWQQPSRTFRRISTHAFTEGDPRGRANTPRSKYFNSRLHGRRHPQRRLPQKRPWISTHAFTEGDSPVGAVQNGTDISTHAFTEGDTGPHTPVLCFRHFNSRLHGRRLQIQIIFAAKHFLFLLILSKFLILAFLFHLASLRFSLHPVIFPVRISLYFSVYLPFALETCTLCHNI